MTPDLSQHFSQMAPPARGPSASANASAGGQDTEGGGLKSSRHQPSPSGSTADASMISPPETSRISENNAGLPHISKPAAGSTSMHGGHGSHAHAHDSSGHHRGAGSDLADDSGTDGGSYRLHGLHAQSSMDQVPPVDDGSLPPIANLSLGKVNMTGTQRRAVPSGYYDASGSTSYSKNKVAGAKVRQGMPPAVKYSNKMAAGAAGVGGLVQATVAGHKLAPQGASDGIVTGSTSYKYKANAAKSGTSKYISPYSLRQLAGAGPGVVKE